MNFLFYSSPYKYYYENIEPIASLAESKGHNVYKRFSLKIEENIRDKEKGFFNESIYELLESKKIDVVILTQPWWYLDKEIAGACNKFRIPFYIVDHAPPMMTYTEESGKKSHKYRANLLNAKAFFAYGPATKRVMRARGCREKIITIGSPRIKTMLDKYFKITKEKKHDFKSFVVYDTSHRMEDPKIRKEIIKLRKSLGPDWKVFLKKHQRSPGFFDKIVDGILTGPEEQAVYFADKIGFTFPSSAMILPALVNKEMISLYDNHFCREANAYFKIYQNSIPNRIGKKKEDYRQFLLDNYYSKDDPSIKILNYIEEDL